MKRNLFLQLIIFCFVLFLGAKVCGASVSKVDAKAWVNDKGRELLDTFNEPNLAEKYRRLDKLFVEYVDLDYISKFVVGKYWRQMSPEQQKRYQEIFKRYALGVYKGFPLSFEQKINFDVNSVQSEKDYTDVTTSIVLEEKKDNQQPQTFLVVFRLVEVEGGYKIIDLKFAESSLILSYRSRFYELFANDDGDIEWFLEDLENMAVSAEKANALRLKSESLK